MAEAAAGAGRRTVSLAAVPLLLLAAAAVLLQPETASAQTGPAWDAPSFHLPGGEDGYGVYVTFPQDLGAVGAAGTWRRSGTYVDLGLRAGIANVERPGGASDLGLSAGVELKNELISAYESFPLDVAWATGAGASVVPERDLATVRIPVGLVVGRRIEAEGVTVTPFAYPRLALEATFRDDGAGPGPGGGAGDDLDLRVDLDVGADVRFRDEWSVRVGFNLGRSFTAGAGLTF